MSGMVDLGGNHVQPLSPAVVGKAWTLDLSKTYKQLPISTDSRNLSVLGFGVFLQE